MGLFSKRDVCPICGREAKGLFLTRIADKKTLCRDCSEQISMSKELLKTASPDFIREHLNYRQKNAEQFTAAHWDVKYEALWLEMGVDLKGKLIYLAHGDLNDKDNPALFSFEQLTGYELFRLKKKVDSADDPGDTALESGLSALSGLTKLAGKSSNSTDYLTLRLTTSNPYWPLIKLEFINPDTELYGLGGCAKELQAMCQVFKRIVRQEPVHI